MTSIIVFITETPTGLHFDTAGAENTPTANEKAHQTALLESLRRMLPMQPASSLALDPEQTTKRMQALYEAALASYRGRS